MTSSSASPNSIDWLTDLLLISLEVRLIGQQHLFGGKERRRNGEWIDRRRWYGPSDQKPVLRARERSSENQKVHFAHYLRNVEKLACALFSSFRGKIGKAKQSKASKQASAVAEEAITCCSRTHDLGGSNGRTSFDSRPSSRNWEFNNEGISAPGP